MRRKSEQLIVCLSCERRITIRSFCPHCGTPTSFATEEERVDYELTLWRKTRDVAEAAKAVPPAAAANGNGNGNGKGNGNGNGTQYVVRRRQIAQAQLLPTADRISVSNGEGEHRIEVLYRPEAAPPARKPHVQKPPRPRKQRTPKPPRAPKERAPKPPRARKERAPKPPRARKERAR